MIDPLRLSKVKVLVVGDVMLDRYWYGDVERISPEAPVPVAHISREEERLGGAANVANNIVSLGAKSTLMTVLGDDEPAIVIKNLLSIQRIEQAIHQDTAIQTTVKLRVIARSQQLIRLDFEIKPNHDVLKESLENFKRVAQDFDVILFSDYGKGGLFHVSEMIEFAALFGKPILIDPKGGDYSKYAGATIITPNRAELKEVIGNWSNEAELLKKTNELRDQLNLTAILLTRSEEGMTLFQKDNISKTIPTIAQEVFDVTGAGDTVIGTLAAMLGYGCTISEAVEFANKAASVVVAKLGTATLTLDELNGVYS